MKDAAADWMTQTGVSISAGDLPLCALRDERRVGRSGR